MRSQSKVLYDLYYILQFHFRYHFFLCAFVGLCFAARGWRCPHLPWLPPHALQVLSMLSHAALPENLTSAHGTGSKLKQTRGAQHDHITCVALCVGDWHDTYIDDAKVVATCLGAWVLSA